VHLVMFDIDGTLVESYDFDSSCFVDAVVDILGVRINDDVALVFATGGWLESAKMKLSAAEIHFPDIPIASASDHYSRLEIMRLAEIRAV